MGNQYSEDLKNAYDLLASGFYDSCVSKCATIFEVAFKDIYRNYLSNLTSKRERDEFQKIEEEVGKHQQTFQKFGFGELVGLARKMKLFNKLRNSLISDLQRINTINFDGLVKLRNSVLHDNKNVTEVDANLFYTNLKIFLLDTCLIEPEFAELFEKNGKSTQFVSGKAQDITVDQFNNGDYMTISEALQAVNPGGTILINPGIYEESILITKPVFLSGQGQENSVEIINSDSDTIRIDAPTGKVIGLTVRHTGRTTGYGINIQSGKWEIAKCIVLSSSLSCIGICNNANPTIFQCEISRSRLSGVYIHNGGRALLKENKIFEHALSGIVLETGADATIDSNSIFRCKQDGIFSTDRSRATILNNKISDNHHNGIFIEGNSQIKCENNVIKHNNEYGIKITENASGNFSDNRISENKNGSYNVDENDLNLKI